MQALTDGIMDRIGQLIPVTPVPLVCAAIQSLHGDVLARAKLVARIGELRDALVELNARVVRADRDAADTLDVALRMLRMRRVLLPSDDAGVEEGYVLLPRGRELVSYYANSVAHLLGDYAAGIRARDALPAEDFAG